MNEDLLNRQMKLPTIRISLVRGLHHLRIAGELTQFFVLTQPTLANAARKIESHLSLAQTDYEKDVDNLEVELQEKEETIRECAAKLIHAEAALELEKAAVRGYINDLDTVRDQLHEKNKGFVEAMQKINQEHAKLDCDLEDAKTKIETLKLVVRKQDDQLAQLQKSGVALLAWLRQKKITIPKNFIA